jgi:hypothetical protein
MNKRKPITKKQIEILKKAGIPEMWNKNYAGEYVQIGENYLVSLGGQGHMDEKYNILSNTEKYWGGIIDNIPFIVTTFSYNEAIGENVYNLYMKIDVISVKAEQLDVEQFLNSFRKLVLDYGMVLPKSRIESCAFVNKPRIKYIQKN